MEVDWAKYENWKLCLDSYTWARKNKEKPSVLEPFSYWYYKEILKPNFARS